MGEVARAQGASSAALEPFLQVPQVRGHFFPRLRVDDERHKQLANPVSSHQEQGWNLLCNGVITFDDTGELLPDGTSIRPHRGSALHTPGWVATSDSAHCADGTGTRCAWSWPFAWPTDAIRV